jgi:hypothetical protein
LLSASKWPQLAKSGTIKVEELFITSYSQDIDQGFAT